MPYCNRCKFTHSPPIWPVGCRVFKGAAIQEEQDLIGIADRLEAIDSAIQDLVDRVTDLENP